MPSAMARVQKKLDEDFSEASDLASAMPDKLKARRHSMLGYVNPIDSRRRCD
jgi:hypothetical protein